MFFDSSFEIKTFYCNASLLLIWRPFFLSVDVFSFFSEELVSSRKEKAPWLFMIAFAKKSFAQELSDLRREVIVHSWLNAFTVYCL